MHRLSNKKRETEIEFEKKAANLLRCALRARLQWNSMEFCNGIQPLSFNGDPNATVR